jgi:Fur family peroxide stress response transcriptional regulator
VPSKHHYFLKERKHSDKRDAILKAIRSTSTHPSAQWVYEKLKPFIPNLSLGTVYRNINLFLHEGLVMSVGVVDGEERFDGIVEPHPHLVCSRCGRVMDLSYPETHIARAVSAAGFLPPAAGGTECQNPQKPGDGPESGGFTVDYRKTVFYGLCGSCGEF